MKNGDVQDLIDFVSDHSDHGSEDEREQGVRQRVKQAQGIFHSEQGGDGRQINLIKDNRKANRKDNRKADQKDNRKGDQKDNRKGGQKDNRKGGREEKEDKEGKKKVKQRLERRKVTKNVAGQTAGRRMIITKQNPDSKSVKRHTKKGSA